MGFRSRIRHANRSSARLPTKWRLQKYHHRNWCILNICFCIPRIQSKSRQHSQSYHQHLDKTCVLTYCIDNRKSLCFRLKCDTRINWSRRHHASPCNHEACANYRSHRKNECHDKDNAENVFRRISQKMEQISTISIFKLKNNLSLSRIIHGRVPYNILNHKFGLSVKTCLLSTTDFAAELLRRAQIFYDKTKKSVMPSIISYKKYYDKQSKSFAVTTKRLLLRLTT